ncbi:MAG TPA: hypothetical protein P5169_08155, partial [Kiritimatiellia bacterium]|nr:hypothetical protein [Kiritimatiellia bacterium]
MKPERPDRPLFFCAACAALRGGFSTVWKVYFEIFHAMEKMFPRCGKVLWGDGAARGGEERGSVGEELG